MKTPLPLPSQEYLQYHFYYNPKTGKFYRRFAQAPAPIGSTTIPKKTGYLSQCIDSKYYLTHRLIWMYMTGEDPGVLQVDHKDRNRSNNEWSNLRLGSLQRNAENRDAKGCYWRPKDKAWVAQIMTNGENIYLGSFTEHSDARAAYLKAKEELHSFYLA